MNIRKKVSPSHPGLSVSKTGGTYMKFVKQNVATTPSEFKDAMDKYKLTNPERYTHMLRFWGLDAYSQGTDAFSLGTSARALGLDAYSQGTDARSQGTAKKQTVFKTKGKETLPRDPHAILGLLRDHFTENELDTVFKLPSAGSFSGCENKPPTNLYRLCNASKPNCFKGKNCFQPGRYESISAIFKKSKSTNKLFKVE